MNHILLITSNYHGENQKGLGGETAWPNLLPVSTSICRCCTGAASYGVQHWQRTPQFRISCIKKPENPEWKKSWNRWHMCRNLKWQHRSLNEELYMGLMMCFPKTRRTDWLRSLTSHWVENRMWKLCRRILLCIVKSEVSEVPYPSLVFAWWIRIICSTNFVFWCFVGKASNHFIHFFIMAKHTSISTSVNASGFQHELNIHGIFWLYLCISPNY